MDQLDKANEGELRLQHGQVATLATRATLAILIATLAVLTILAIFATSFHRSEPRGAHRLRLVY